MKYKAIVLTYNNPIYNFFDCIKRKDLQDRNIPHQFVYNDTVMIDLYNETNNSVLITSAGIFSMFNKFIHTIKDSSYNEFDYIVRANSSTFLNFPLLEQFIEKLPKENCYAGYFTQPGTPKDFVSGTCMIFSKDIINKLQNININYIPSKEDDLVIFDLMNQFKIPKTYIPMYWYNNNTIPEKDELNNVLNEYPLIRVNNPSNREVFDKAIWNMIAQIKNI